MAFRRKKDDIRVITAESARRAERLLEVNDLNTSFKTPRGLARADDNVSFALDRGKTLGIVGESGCGKSVLSRSIMGLLPKRNVVREGEILFNGENITELS